MVRPRFRAKNHFRDFGALVVLLYDSTAWAGSEFNNIDRPHRQRAMRSE